MNTFDLLLAVFQTVFEDEINTDAVTQDTVLETLGISSVGYLYLAIAIEERFGARLDNADFASFTTVGDVVRRIEKKMPR